MSKAIEELERDHDAILSSLELLQAMVARASRGELPAEDARSFIAFLREFADTCHHGKEEGILFPALVDAGLPSAEGPVGVMLAEHVEGRARIREMEEAVTATVDPVRFARAAGAYAQLLRGHILKENQVLFPAAERMLAPDQLEAIHRRFQEHEETVIGHGRHEQLHALLKELRQRYRE